MKPSGLVAQAIGERYGPACDVFDPECDTCRAWEWFRAAATALKEPSSE